MGSSKQHYIKIPKEITLLYSEKNQLITFIGLYNIKSIKLKTKIKIIKNKNIIEVSNSSFNLLSNNCKKKLKAIQGTSVRVIKSIMAETYTIFHLKLKFVGVGYRAFYVENFKKTLLLLKLGFSHYIYFKIPKNIKSLCFKFTTLFLFSNSYQNLYRVAGRIRNFKPPEPYKGKGILYYTENIQLKEGKKV